MSILFDPVDLTIVLLGAVLCSCLGALLPAWRAAKVDPFDAIVEGRFK
jgi:ABC-type lipoprotein release transport system permease subunit